MSTLAYVASALLALTLGASLIGVVFFTALLFERAVQAHRRGMDRVHIDKWWRENGEPCRFCGRTFICDEGCGRLDRLHAGEAS